MAARCQAGVRSPYFTAFIRRSFLSWRSERTATPASRPYRWDQARSQGGAFFFGALKPVSGQGSHGLLFVHLYRVNLNGLKEVYQKAFCGTTAKMKLSFHSNVYPGLKKSLPHYGSKPFSVQFLSNVALLRRLWQPSCRQYSVSSNFLARIQLPHIRDNLLLPKMALLYSKSSHLGPTFSSVQRNVNNIAYPSMRRSFSSTTKVRNQVSQEAALTPPAPVTSGGVHPTSGPKLKLSLLASIREKLGVTPRMLLVLGHTASLFGVLALYMKDMLWLRTFMVCGSCCGIAFNMLQPSPLKIPAMWGCVFIAINVFQIGVLLHERRPITFKTEEAEVYAAVFQKHGVTPHQFEKLMRQAGATWLDLPAGHVILKEGDLVEYVSVIVSGRIEVSKDGEMVGEMGPGCLIGETSLLLQDHRAGHTVLTAEPSRIVSWPRSRLSQTLACDQNLLLSTAHVINSDLALKLKNSANLSNRAKVLEVYQEVMKGICCDGIIRPVEKRALREYRITHHITNAQHLEAVAMCGWTPEEYEDGAKLDMHKHQFSLRKSIETFNRSIATAVGAGRQSRGPPKIAEGTESPLPGGTPLGSLSPS